MNNLANQPPSASAVLLRLPHIAAWQIASTPAVAGPTEAPITAALPAMQRGAVWKPRQVEMLWDSIVRGFPIGSFLLSPFDPDRGTQTAKHQQAGLGRPNYHLLDGQQRSTAIALGFLDPWKAQAQGESAVLWVDLAAPDEKSDAEYVFRVLTRSHPWGYKRINPDEVLTVKAIRDALDDGFRKASTQLQNTRPEQIPLTHVWPKDAEAPVPLVFLIAALATADKENSDTVTSLVMERLRALPFWNAKDCLWTEVQARLEGALLGTDPALHERWTRLIANLAETALLSADYGVPALILPHTARPATEATADPLETLFIRVNQAGTRLEGEELMYSILKSAWVDAPRFVEGLSARLTHPPRLVALATRLVLAQVQQMQEPTTSRPPASPDVAQFRRLIYGQDKMREDFKARLTNFVQGPGKAVFEDARALLTDPSLPGKDHVLPPVLGFEIAYKTPDVAFLLLNWVWRMRQAGHDPRAIKPDQHHRLLGFLTALSWFAPDPGNAVAAIWSRLNKTDPKDLSGFFGRAAFKEALRLGRNDKLLACPLPPPKVLEQVIQNRVTSPRSKYGSFRDPASPFWSSWTWYEWLQRSLPGVLNDWFTEHLDALWDGAARDEDGEPLDGAAKRGEAWTHFSNQLWEKRSLLLFVQRDWLRRWFPDYDPTVPDQVEDKNRPWDFDHIHPQRYLVSDSGSSRRKIPPIVWDWHQSIGNLRAWPLEANRSDGDTSPRIKLSTVGPAEQRYGISDPSTKCAASFVDFPGDEWDDDWCKSVPAKVESGERPLRYLAIPDDIGGPARQALIRAITSRFTRLYRHWYEALRIGDLMP